MLRGPTMTVAARPSVHACATDSRLAASSSPARLTTSVLGAGFEDDADRLSVDRHFPEGVAVACEAVEACRVARTTMLQPQGLIAVNRVVRRRRIAAARREVGQPILEVAAGPRWHGPRQRIEHHARVSLT